MSLSPLGRVVEIAEEGRHLSKQRGFLVVSAVGAEVGRVPLDDVSAVIATALTTTASCALLSDLATRGVPFVLCGRNYAPSGLLWPVAGHHAQQRRMEAQVDRTRSLGGRLWTRSLRRRYGGRAGPWPRRVVCMAHSSGWHGWSSLAIPRTSKLARRGAIGR